MQHQTKSHRKVLQLHDNSIELQAHPVSNLLQNPCCDTLSEDKIKRRKRRHRKVRLRDLEVEREVKLEKIMTRREGMWNSRFVNETIPDLFARRVRPSLPSHQKKEKEMLHKKPQSSLQIAHLQKEFEKTKLPSLTVRADKKANLRKSMHKTIKIQHLDELFPKKKESFIKQDIFIKTSRKITKVEIESDPPTRQEEVKKEEVREIKQDPTEIILQHSLAALLAEKTAKHPINAGYCDLLSDLIHHAQQTHHHELTELLTGEIEAIGTQRQTDCAITQYIERRKQLIQQLGQHQQPFQKYQACLKLQETSLAVVELILKYRAKWEDLYWQQLAAHRRVHFHHQGSNYLTQMASEVHQLASAEVCDPFLIATTARLRRALQQPSNPELTLRLRACELLLIEEDLLA